MKKLSEDVLHFFRNQGCVVVSTIDKKGMIHCACKGIVKIDSEGRVYLMDLYLGQTHQNLKNNPQISITAVDEHKFTGYSLKGKGEIVSGEKLEAELAVEWEARITSRLTQRLLKNIREEKGHPRHPEEMMPKPKYMIVIQVEEVVDLTPHHLK
jgi:predicted pyridoxine 5'-phosphate oxidase superfamily flavin-nucleotide-binding protein